MVGLDAGRSQTGIPRVSGNDIGTIGYACKLVSFVFPRAEYTADAFHLIFSPFQTTAGRISPAVFLLYHAS